MAGLIFLACLLLTTLGCPMPSSPVDPGVDAGNSTSSFDVGDDDVRWEDEDVEEVENGTDYGVVWRGCLSLGRIGGEKMFSATR